MYDNKKEHLIEEEFEEWLSVQNYSESTVYQSLLTVKEYHRFHQTTSSTIPPPSQISLKEINNYVNHLLKRPNKRRSGGLSISHINKQIHQLNLYLEFLLNNDYIADTIYLEPLLNKEKKTPKVFRPEEIEILYENCVDDTYHTYRDKLILHLYYGCGLRKTEGESILLHHIDFENRTLFIPKTKNNESRIIPVHQGILKDLHHYIYELRKPVCREKFTKNHLFISQTNRPLSSQKLYLDFKDLCNRSKIEPTGLHTLRHSIATHLYHNGMSIQELSQFLGHRSMDSTQLYTHVNYEED